MYYGAVNPTEPTIGLTWGDARWGEDISPWNPTRADAITAAEGDSALHAVNDPMWIATTTSYRTSSEYSQETWTVTQEFGVEYSADGEDGWDAIKSTTDNYMRFRLPDGSYSEVIRITQQNTNWVQLFNGLAYNNGSGLTSSRRYAFTRNLGLYDELLFFIRPQNSDGELGIRYSTLVSKATTGSWKFDTNDDDMVRDTSWAWTYHYAHGFAIGNLQSNEWYPNRPSDATQNQGGHNMPTVVSGRLKFVGTALDSLTFIRFYDFKSTNKRLRVRIFGRKLGS